MWHRHEHEYFVLPLFNDDLQIDTSSRTVSGSLTTGGSYFGNAGVADDVCNGNDVACIVIEVEQLEVSYKG